MSCHGASNRSRPQLGAAIFVMAFCVVFGCTSPDPETADGGDDSSSDLPQATARLSLPNPPMLNIATSDECPEWQQEDLREPVKIHPLDDGVLETQLVVGLKERCVPVFTTGVGWEYKKLALRTYGHPKDHSTAISGDDLTDDENIVWTAPGPTFVLNKATAPGVNDGSNFVMTLFNALEPQADPHGCDELRKLNPPQGPFQPDTAPNCFHGDNSTNFHFHGFHVSPQPHQDWVGLELLPFGSTQPEHAVHTRGSAVVGEYDFNIDRLRYTQAEGTHWYHAHKHGSTALQVLNGLVGTFEIRGAFDAELEALFEDQGGLSERLLVVQQLQETLSGLGNDPSGAPEPLINGMADPILRMKPGEIQRWRFVGATMQDSAKLDIGFPQGAVGGSPEVRQIAMDGVQFAPQNYGCQPILHGPDCEAGTEDDSFKDLKSFTLAPGNRIDILIKAPDTPGRHVMTFDVAGNLQDEVAQELEQRAQERVSLANSKLARLGQKVVDLTDPPLLTLIVEDAEPVDGTFPTVEQFPKIPAYLADLEGPFENRTIAYEMSDRGQLETVSFSICGTKYDPACVNETLTLDVAEEFLLTNNSNIAHPFHIHTNPFQVVRDGDLTYTAPYVWRDVMPIPIGTPADLGEAVIRYVAREFTGEFVNHCHILGHEDRGMMHNVQTVCPNGKWGKPTSDLSAECRDGNYLEAAPKCETGTCPRTSNQ